VAGYQALMPSFAGQLSEEDLLAIIAYLKARSESSHEHD
jgi:mono/diheme cytochrome c family protein